MTFPPIEVRSICPKDTDALARFFQLLRAHGIDKYFHPHPLTVARAGTIANYSGKDFYVAVLEGRDILGYGMLRGWDKGYQIPSVGIAIHPEIQGRGVGRLLMIFLHLAALRRGAKKVRLRVYRDNHSAISMYRAMGYKLTAERGRCNLVGIVTLGSKRTVALPGLGNAVSGHAGERQ
jgi:[ribosomal protein S18]-alanine N-acetyltransferase